PFPGFMAEHRLPFGPLVPKVHSNHGKGGSIPFRLFEHWIENQVVNGLRPKYGKGENKGSATFKLALGLDITLMSFDDFFGNGKSQPRPRDDPCLGSPSLIETVKYFWQVLWGNTHSRIR